jgi:hypothetical protein
MIKSNTIIKRYSQWINENLMAEAGETSQPPAGLNKEIKFNFNFESGKYKPEEIPAPELAKLKTDLNIPSNLVRTPRFMNQKTVLTLTASTSTLGLSANLRAQLQQEGFKPTGNGNDALCAARLKTIEGIVITYFCEKLKCTPEELAKKITIKKVSKPNSGTGATDEERKQFQYISMKLEQTGEAIPSERRIDCNMKPATRQGTQAKREVNYVGYNADQIVVVPAGNTVTIKLNPLTVPDMVYFKYKGEEFLSPWLGAKTSVNPRTGQNNNFEADLNDATKYPGLKDAINAEIKKIGGKFTVETALAANGGWVNNKFVVLPGPGQKGDPGVFSFTMTKGFDLDNLTIRVFSPLAGTAFTIESSCGGPSATVKN